MLVLRRGTLLEFVPLEFHRFLLELLAPALVLVRARFVLKSRIVLVLDRRPHLVLIVFTVLLSILIRIVLRTSLDPSSIRNDSSDFQFVRASRSIVRTTSFVDSPDRTSRVDRTWNAARTLSDENRT